MGRISVIIPTYNRARFLIESVNAIQMQSYPVYEIIVVDDGSTDDTQATVSALSGPIQYVHQPNAGKSVALNKGMELCTGDYIWICDDDDLALPRAAELLVNALEANSTVGFAFGRFKRLFVDPRTGERRLFEPVYWPDFDSNSFLVGLLLDCFIYQNACLVRRATFDAVGPFRADLIRSQDYEMTVRLVCRFDAAYVPEVVFLQRDHHESRGSSADRFDPSRQMEKWLHYDAIFFRDLYGKLPLSRFAPKTMAGAAPQSLNRAALLQRACIFWRRKLFEFSLRDMGEAIHKSDSTHLTTIEETICRDFLHPKFGCNELLSRPEIVKALYALADESEFGRSVIKAVTTPLLWFIRYAFMHGRWVESWTLGTLLLRVHGALGTATLITHNLSRRLKIVD